MQACTAETLPKRKPLGLRQNIMVSDNLVQAIKGNPAGQMLHVVNADVRGYPAQDPRQIVMRTAIEGGILHVPVCLAIPSRVFELNPEDFAIGTGMNALAEAHRFVVIYPQQSRGDNPQSCWNWFSRSDQRRDRGEPAILAGMTRKVMAEFGVSSDRTLSRVFLPVPRWP